MSPLIVQYAFLAIALLLFVVVPLLQYGIAFVRSLHQKQSVALYARKEAGVPDAYTTAMTQAATVDLGFRWLEAGEHVSWPGNNGTLLVSPDRTTLAVVSAGPIAGAHTRLTLLITQLADGHVVLSTDLPIGAELDANTHWHVLVHADFYELWRLQKAGVADRRAPAVPFDPDVSWATLDALHAARVARLVEAGLARYLEEDPMRFRYTARAAFRASIVHGLKQKFAAGDGGRRYRARPGDRGAVLPAAVDVADVATAVPASSSKNESTLRSNP